METRVRRGIIANTIAISAVLLSGRLIRFVYIAVLSRLLAPDVIGFFLYAVSFYLVFAPVAMFGQSGLLAARIGRGPSQVAGMFGRSITVVALSTLCCALLAVAITLLTEADWHNRLVLFGFIAALIFRSATTWMRAAWIALEDATWMPRFELYFRGGEAVLGVAIVLMGGDIVLLAWLHAATWLLESAATAWRCRRFPGVGREMRSRLRRSAQFLRTSSVIFANNWSLLIVIHVAIILLRHVQPDTAVVAQFSIAMQFFSALAILPQAFGQAFLPALSRGYRDSGRQLLALQSAIKIAILASTVLAVLLYAYAEPIIVLILSERYETAARIFSWLCFGFAPYAVLLILAQSLLAFRGRGTAAAISATVVALHVGAFFVLIEFGLYGAAGTSLLLALGIGALLACVTVGRRLGIEGQTWWLLPASVMSLVIVVMIVTPVPAMVLSPLLAILVLVAIKSGLFFSHAELDLIAEKMPSAKLRHLVGRAL